MSTDNTESIPKLQVCKSTGNTTVKIGDKRELILFRLKMWNRTESDLSNVVLRIYDADEDELISAYPLVVSFKSRRMRGEKEVFTPYLTKLVIPDYVKKIQFKIELLRPVPGQEFHTDFEVKFDFF